jgi:hypothetical protein
LIPVVALMFAALPSGKQAVSADKGMILRAILAN